MSYYQPQIVEISKKDDVGNNVEGATLELYFNDSTEVLKTWTTTQESKSLFLMPGKYTLKEKVTPNGYKIANDVIFFVDINDRLTRDGKTVSSIIMEDERKDTKVIVHHYIDGTTTPVPLKTGGIATEQTITLNYYYTHVSGGVIEKHVDDITGEILENKTHQGGEGTPYNIPSKTFEGYELVENKLPTNAIGTMKKDAIEVVYYYKYPTKVIAKYIDKETGKEIEAQVEKKDITEKTTRQKKKK